MSAVQSSFPRESLESPSPQGGRPPRAAPWPACVQCSVDDGRALLVAVSGATVRLHWECLDPWVADNPGT